MSGNPRVVLATVTAPWPPGSAMPMRWVTGEMVDVTPGSVLESVLVADNLRLATPADWCGHGNGLAN